MKKGLSIVFLAIIGALFFLLTLRGSWGNPETQSQLGALSAETKPFESSHERAPYAEMLAIKNRGTIELGKELARFASPDVGYENGKYYSFFPSGVSYTALVFYQLGAPFRLGQIAVYTSSVIFSILTMIFIFLITVDIFKRQYWAGILAAYTYAFATTSWSYSISIYQHAAASFFATFLFYAAWRYKQHRETLLLGGIWSTLFWIALGCALFFDYPNALILFPYCVYFLLTAISVKQERAHTKTTLYLSSVVPATFFLLLVALNGYRNMQYFGSYTKFGNSLPRYTQTVEQKTATKSASISNTTPQEERSYSGILQEEFVPRSGATLLFGIDKGLFLFSPVLFLALFGIYTASQRRSIEVATGLGGILSTIFVYFSFGDPWGGWAYGPRYLIPMMTIASIFVMIWVSQKKQGLLRRAVFLLFFATSSAIALAGPLTTNLIPPKVEADYLKLPFYNFLRAFDLLVQGRSSSFIYTNYVADKLTLLNYFYSIWGALLLIVTIILFVVPLFEKQREVDN